MRTPAAVDAMATRFELVLGDGEQDDPSRRAIAEEALAEIVRLGTRLSKFQPMSDVSWINAHASHRPVKVEPKLFALLQRCVELSAATDGAFDITVGPMMQAWKFVGESGALPSPEQVAGARTRAGYRHLRLDAEASTIKFGRAGMSLDLGGGERDTRLTKRPRFFARTGSRARCCTAARAAFTDRRAGPGAAGGLRGSRPRAARASSRQTDAALSVSAVHGKAFAHEGRQLGHVIDPAPGWPTDGAASAVVTGSRSLECDALSTALLVHGRAWLPMLRSRFPGYDGAVR